MTFVGQEQSINTGNAAPFEWGSLENPAHRRIGVVDVGSNSVRLVVYDGIARSPSYFYNEKVLCGLGIGIHETGILNPQGRARALAALHRFVALARLMKLNGLQGVATAAVREAEDGPDFCAQVLTETGLDLHVATGNEEAELSAKGVLLGWPHANGMVCDIGGASMELARVDDGVISTLKSSRLGPMQLVNLGSNDAINAEITRIISILRTKLPDPVHNLFLVGGSWRAIARLDMERRNYPLHVLHEYRLTPEQIIETAHWATTKTPFRSRAAPLRVRRIVSASRLNSVSSKPAETAPDSIAPRRMALPSIAAWDWRSGGEQVQ